MDRFCSKTKKQCFTEREAGDRLNYLKRGRTKSGKKIIPKRKYLCRDCGFYHLTHLTSYAHSDFCKTGHINNTDLKKRRTSKGIYKK